MTLTTQILVGSICLTFCAFVHVAIVAAAIPVLVQMGERLKGTRPVLRSGGLLSAGVLAIVFGHTVQIWLWAAIFNRVQAFEDFATSFYFAMVTYTTLGYGDFVLDEGLRVFAAFASVTGLLTFGVSTALLLGLIIPLLPALRQDA